MDEKKSLKEKGKFLSNELVLCYEPDPVKAKVLYDAKVGLFFVVLYVFLFVVIRLFLFI